MGGQPGFDRVCFRRLGKKGGGTAKELVINSSKGHRKLVLKLNEPKRMFNFDNIVPVADKTYRHRDRKAATET